MIENKYFWILKQTDSRFLKIHISHPSFPEINDITLSVNGSKVSGINFAIQLELDKAEHAQEKIHKEYQYLIFAGRSSELYID